mgnify:CR=1 FL=1
MSKNYQSESLGALRILSAALFILHGTSKFFAFPIPFPSGKPEIASLLGAAGIIELIGGGLVLVGLFTRPAALIIAGEMAAAYLIGHATRSPWPIANGGELALIFLVAFFHIAMAGPGSWAMDDKR